MQTSNPPPHEHDDFDEEVTCPECGCTFALEPLAAEDEEGPNSEGTSSDEAELRQEARYEYADDDEMD